jgi:hypothetical protein
MRVSTTVNLPTKRRIVQKTVVFHKKRRPASL